LFNVYLVELDDDGTEIRCARADGEVHLSDEDISLIARNEEDAGLDYWVEKIDGIEIQSVSE
jgi:molybdenum cofactor biosynthesis enzyme